LKPEEHIDARDVWAIIKASAVNRLGVPLLRVWAAYVIVAVLIVAGSVAWMYLRP
jgi:hypothetical protein